MLGAATSFAASVDYPANPSEAQTPVKAKFKLPENGGENPEPSNPTDPDHPTENPDGNKPLDPKGPFGIAYVPNQFMTQNFEGEGEALNESGEQTFAFKNTDVRVGVKDKTHTNGGWTLKAKLTWDSTELPGSTITMGTETPQINKGKNQYDSQTDVTAAAGTLTLNNVDIEIMNGKNLTDGNLYNATYDMKLTNPSLKIADTAKVSAGTYTGDVTWTLTAAAVY